MNKIRKIIIAPKAIYNSRKIIKNLYSSLYQYLILRKQNIELKLRNGETIKVSRFLYPRVIYYSKYIENITRDYMYLKINNKTFQLSLKEIELLGFWHIIRSLKRVGYIIKIIGRKII